MSRSRWYLAPMVAALFAAPLRHADAQMVSFGVMAGLSQSTFTGDALQDARNAGVIAGAFVRLGALGFAVQPGLYYTAKGAQSSDFNESTGVGTRTSLDYIQIPIVIRIHLGPLYVGGGPAIGFKLGCKITAPQVRDTLPGQATTSSTSDCPATTSAAGVKSTEFSGILEAGVEFGKFSLGGRADIGLTNALEAINTGSTANVTAKTQTVSVVAAIRF